MGVALAGCSINPGSLTPGEPQPAPSPPGSNIALLTERHQPRGANNERGAMLALADEADEALADCNKAISLGANYGEAFARLAYERLGEDKAAGSCTRGA